MKELYLKVSVDRLCSKFESRMAKLRPSETMVDPSAAHLAVPSMCIVSSSGHRQWLHQRSSGLNLVCAWPKRRRRIDLNHSVLHTDFLWCVHLTYRLPPPLRLSVLSLTTSILHQALMHRSRCNAWNIKRAARRRLDKEVKLSNPQSRGASHRIMKSKKVHPSMDWSHSGA